MKRMLKKARISTIAMAMIAGATIGAGTLSLTPAKGADLPQVAPVATSPAEAAPAPLASAEALSNTFSSVVEQVSPAVVFIDVERKAKETPAGFFGPGDGAPVDPFRFFFGPGGPGRGRMPMQSPAVRGQGSGFIITPDGYIVTNNHVVGDMDRVRVTLSDGRRFDATLVGTDPQTEVALIKVDAQNLPTVPLGDSEKLRVGEWVLAIGSPFGLSHTVTEGIVSARGRGNVGIVDYADFIQTDAAINPGNSGGPLLNLRGEVVGMNTAILSPSGSSAGIGFAIPVNMVKYIVDELRNTGTVTRGYLGVNIQELSPELAQYFDIDQNQGLIVANVSPDSPAEKAGIKRDDVIIALNGQPIGEGGAFRSQVSTTAPGTTARLTILREGQRLEQDVVVGKLPRQEGEDDAAPAAAGEDESEGGTLGVVVQPLTSEIAAQLGYEGESGVVVTAVQPGSPAERAGLRPGSLIKEVNRQPIAAPAEIKAALKNGARNNTVLLLVREGEGTRYLAVDIA